MLTKFYGWDGRIRTYDTLYQKQMPYHLATSQYHCIIYDGRKECSRPNLFFYLNYSTNLGPFLGLMKVKALCNLDVAG